MSTDPPERPPARALLSALPLRRNVAVGLAVGVSLAATLFTVRYLELFGPAPDRGSPALFLALAFVLATTMAGLVFSVLTIVSLVRVLRREGDPDAG